MVAPIASPLVNSPIIKMCGLRTPGDLLAADAAGADWIGFVHFPRSPRHLDADAVAALSHAAAPRLRRVLLVVDADDMTLDALTCGARIDMIQLHGSETPDRVAEVRARWGRPVMKAVGIREAADLDRAAVYEAADWLLLDAKAPEGSDRPGGNGTGFDWSLLSDRAPDRPWMLAGGLTPDTVFDALRRTGATAIDASSGLESASGEKDPARMAAFCAAARRVAAPA